MHLKHLEWASIHVIITIIEWNITCFSIARWVPSLLEEASMKNIYSVKEI